MRYNFYKAEKINKTGALKQYKTTESITVNFFGYGDVTIPENTLVTNETSIDFDDKFAYVSEFSWIDKNYSAYASMLKFDAENYGINIPMTKRDKLKQI